MTSEPDYESEFLEQKIREGKYGLDLYHGEGGDKETALAWYLPRISDKLRRVEQRLKRDAVTKEESLALVPLPPAVQEAKKSLALTPASTREVWLTSIVITTTILVWYFIVIIISIVYMHMYIGN